MRKNELVFLTDNVKSLKQAKKRVDEITLETISNPAKRKRVRKKSKKLLADLGSFVTTKIEDGGEQVLEILLSKYSQAKCDEFTPASKFRAHKQKKKKAKKKGRRRNIKPLPAK